MASTAPGSTLRSTEEKDNIAAEEFDEPALAILLDFGRAIGSSPSIRPPEIPGPKLYSTPLPAREIDSWRHTRNSPASTGFRRTTSVLRVRCCLCADGVFRALVSAGPRRIDPEDSLFWTHRRGHPRQVPALEVKPRWGAGLCQRQLWQPGLR